jgi:DNA-binding XRE family transcriptional regulator
MEMPRAIVVPLESSCLLGCDKDDSPECNSEHVSGYGGVFRTVRERRGLTLREAAKRMGITEDGLSKIEKEHSGISLKTLIAMATAYGCTLDELIPLRGKDAKTDE